MVSSSTEVTLVSAATAAVPSWLPRDAVSDNSSVRLCTLSAISITCETSSPSGKVCCSSGMSSSYIFLQGRNCEYLGDLTPEHRIHRERERERERERSFVKNSIFRANNPISDRKDLSSVTLATSGTNALFYYYFK